MRYTADHDYHIHSFLSPCSRDENQTPERILQYAQENGFKHICLTNHLWDEAVDGCYGAPKDQTYEYLCTAKPLPQTEDTVFHFGFETDMDKNFVLGTSQRVFDDVEFVIISTTHLQLTGKTIENGATLSQRAALYIKRLENIVSRQLDFKKVGIAHPVSAHASPENPFNELFSLIGEENIRRVFTAVAHSGAGVEINSVDFNLKNKTTQHINSMVRFYSILKECGCKFYLGSDAHHPVGLDQARQRFENAIDLLSLKESDKFYPSFLG